LHGWEEMFCSVATNRISVCHKFRVGLDACIAEGRGSSQVCLLGHLVLIKDGFFLSISQHEQLLLFLGRNIGVGSCPLLDFILKNREKRVILILHSAITQANKSRLEEFFLDSGTAVWVC